MIAAYCAFLGVPVQSGPDLRRRSSGGKRESCRHYANYGVGLRVESDRLADDVRVRPEIAMPKRLRDHHGMRGSGGIVFSGERSSQERFDAKDREEIRGNAVAVDRLRMTRSGQGKAFEMVDRHFEGIVLRLPVQEICR